MTDEQHNKFLTLLMGGCWHQWSIQGDYNRCIHCKELVPEGEHSNHLSNPLLVIRWMEKEMPEVLEEYLCHISEVTVTNIDWIEEVINLRNLVDYLWEHTEAPFLWGFIPCPSFPDCMSGETDKCDFPDKGCEGNGEVRGHIHPALQFLRSIKEVRDEK